MGARRRSLLGGKRVTGVSDGGDDDDVTVPAIPPIGTSFDAAPPGPEPRPEAPAAAPVAAPEPPTQWVTHAPPPAPADSSGVPDAALLMPPEPPRARFSNPPAPTPSTPPTPFLQPAWRPTSDLEGFEDTGNEDLERIAGDLVAPPPRAPMASAVPTAAPAEAPQPPPRAALEPARPTPVDPASFTPSAQQRTYQPPEETHPVAVAPPITPDSSTIKVQRPAELTRAPGGRGGADAPDAWGPGWNPGGAPAQAARSGPPRASDAKVAPELFSGGGYEELEDVPPPTEEVRSGVLEDVGQSYSTPYSVPEPPPIPGIVDRFTPPPAQRTDLGGRKRKPDYLSDTPEGGGSAKYNPTPVPAKRRPKSDDDGEGRSGAPFIALLGIGAIAVLGLGLVAVAIAYVMVNNSDGDDPDRGTGLTPGPAPVGGAVELRDDMRRQPGLIGVEPEAPPPVPVAPVDPVPVDPVPAQPPPVPGPNPGPKPAVPGPRPPPNPGPKPQPAQPAAAQGVLKIRANRRAVVYVNNQVIGFTPYDHKVGAGTYTIAAMLPGQPATRQERSVTVSAAGGTSAIDFAF